MRLISAGHDEVKQGATYENNGSLITEFMLASKWADLITELLGDKAIRVPNGTLREKVAFINHTCGTLQGEHIAVEIHFNSFKYWKDLDGDGVVDADEMIAGGRGSETLYMPKSVRGHMAATKVQDHLGRLMYPNRGVHPGYYQRNPDNPVLYFLRKTKCTALIIEPEFIDNIDDINNNMKVACYAIATELLEL